MKFAEVNLLRHRRQVRLFQGVLLQKRDGAFDAPVIFAGFQAGVAVRKKCFGTFHDCVHLPEIILPVCQRATRFLLTFEKNGARRGAA